LIRIQDASINNNVGRFRQDCQVFSLGRYRRSNGECWKGVSSPVPFETPNEYLVGCIQEENPSVKAALLQLMPDGDNLGAVNSTATTKHEG
jgi:hypothetical protein